MDGQSRVVGWRPSQEPGCGVEGCRGEAIELCAGNCVRWATNDPSSGLINLQLA